MEVAGHTLTGNALRGHLHIKTGLDGMIARPASFREDDLMNLSKIWIQEGNRSSDPEKNRSKFWKLFSGRYGLPQDPQSPQGLPLGITAVQAADKNGANFDYHINCYACHIGNVRMPDGQIKPWLGAPNQEFNLSLLIKDLLLARGGVLGGGLTQDTGLYVYDTSIGPLARGQSYAGHLGWLFAPNRNAKLEWAPADTWLRVEKEALDAGADILSLRLPSPKLPYHEYFLATNVKPWWWAKGSTMYSSANMIRDKRWSKWPAGIMFLSPGNNAEFLSSQEFAKALSNIEALVEVAVPPPYPGKIDPEKAKVGHKLFHETQLDTNSGTRSCADCHNHGQLAQVGTDQEISKTFFEYGKMFMKLTSWWKPHTYEDVVNPITVNKKTGDLATPGYYEAPLLTGVWTRNLVLHNASLPLKWLFEGKPKDYTNKVWKIAQIYRGDLERSISGDIVMVRERSDSKVDLREYIDPQRVGNSPAGHEYLTTKANGGQLTKEQQDYIFEYLKVRCTHNDQDTKNIRFGMVDPSGNCI